METNETKRPAVEMLMRYLTRAKDNATFYEQRCKKSDQKMIIAKTTYAVYYEAPLLLLLYACLYISMYAFTSSKTFLVCSRFSARYNIDRHTY